MKVSEIRAKLKALVRDNQDGTIVLSKHIGISRPTLDNFLNYSERKPHKKSLDKIVLWLEKNEAT